MDATASTSPSATKTNAIIQVTREALTGSLSFSLLFPSQALILREGNERSMASACKVRGATITEPTADDMVDAASPNGMATAPPTAIFAMISWCCNRSSTDADRASLYTTKK